MCVCVCVCVRVCVCVKLIEFINQIVKIKCHLKQYRVQEIKPGYQMLSYLRIYLKVTELLTIDILQAELYTNTYANDTIQSYHLSVFIIITTF